MSEAVTFKCPDCGAYLEFDPAHQAFKCPFCGAKYDEETLLRVSREKEKTETARQEHLRTYHCQTCGAEIVTDDTTAATRCYYCHNPIVLSDRLSEEFRPDGVIPFVIDRAAAEKKFAEYLAKKKFVDMRFFSDDQRENISGVYYPYWYADITGSVEFKGEGRLIDVHETTRETITTTRIFDVFKQGAIRLGSMVRQALSKNDRKLSDGIHPYDLEAMKPFAMGYLSGFLAEKRDVTREEARADMQQEAQKLACDMIRTQGTHFDSLRGSTVFQEKDTRMQYCLLPTWVLTYRGDKPGTTYYFMMNGQTGATCGRLPIKWSRVFITAAIAGGAVCAALCAGGALIW